jgi:hypothetical protein
MPIIIFGLTTRAVGALAAVTLIGGLLWVVGSALLISYLGSIRAAADLNATVAFGSASTLTAWILWKDRSMSWRRWLRYFPLAAAGGFVLAWVGLVASGERFAGDPVTRGLPGIPPPTGAWIGGLAGSLVPLGIRAALRGCRGIEP